jgi:hypothetical protein
MDIDIEHQELAQNHAGKLAANALSSLLDLVILNRNKRKAKNIVMTSVQFILSLFVLLNQVEADTGGEIDRQSLVLGIIAILYGAIIIICVMFHARWYLSPDHQTKMEVEEAYKGTNDKPIIDGILEIWLARQFGCPKFCYVLWMMYAAFFALLVLALITSYNSAPYVLSSLLAMMTLYQMTSDVCEYRVHTHQQNLECTTTQKS